MNFENIELKPCPHCGGPGKIISKKSNSDKYWTYVRCTVCGAQGKSFRTVADPTIPFEDRDFSFVFRTIADAWNLRTTPEQATPAEDSANG